MNRYFFLFGILLHLYRMTEILFDKNNTKDSRKVLAQQPSKINSILIGFITHIHLYSSSGICYVLK